jgi:hypothetical protein
MGKSSPTQKSKALLKEQGWEVAIVERWNAFAKIRQDLFGFADLLCLHPQKGIMAVQTTSRSHTSARIDKIRQEPRAHMFLAAGGKIIVHGWKKKKCKIIKYPPLGDKFTEEEI